ncbi:MAG: hypothetical protein RSA97_06510 [Oscillospiraceae bacterium]
MKINKTALVFIVCLIAALALGFFCASRFVVPKLEKSSSEGADQAEKQLVALRIEMVLTCGSADLML